MFNPQRYHAAPLRLCPAFPGQIVPWIFSADATDAGTLNLVRFSSGPLAASFLLTGERQQKQAVRSSKGTGEIPRPLFLVRGMISI